jgi:hypothetical protein
VVAHVALPRGLNQAVAFRLVMVDEDGDTADRSALLVLGTSQYCTIARTAKPLVASGPLPSRLAAACVTSAACAQPFAVVEQDASEDASPRSMATADEAEALRERNIRLRTPFLVWDSINGIAIETAIVGGRPPANLELEKATAVAVRHDSLRGFEIATKMRVSTSPLALHLLLHSATHDALYLVAWDAARGVPFHPLRMFSEVELSIHRRFSRFESGCTSRTAIQAFSRGNIVSREAVRVGVLQLPHAHEQSNWCDAARLARLLGLMCVPTGAIEDQGTALQVFGLLSSLMLCSACQKQHSSSSA